MEHATAIAGWPGANPPSPLGTCSCARTRSPLGARRARTASSGRQLWNTPARERDEAGAAALGQRPRQRRHRVGEGFIEPAGDQGGRFAPRQVGEERGPGRRPGKLRHFAVLRRVGIGPRIGRRRERQRLAILRHVQSVAKVADMLQQDRGPSPAHAEGILQFRANGEPDVSCPTSVARRQLPGLREIWPKPAATLRPVTPSMLAGCRAIWSLLPPTRTLAPRPRPTAASAVAPA